MKPIRYMILFIVLIIAVGCAATPKKPDVPAPEMKEVEHSGEIEEPAEETAEPSPCWDAVKEKAKETGKSLYNKAGDLLDNAMQMFDEYKSEEKKE